MQKDNGQNQAFPFLNFHGSKILAAAYNFIMGVKKQKGEGSILTNFFILCNLAVRLTTSQVAEVEPLKSFQRGEQRSLLTLDVQATCVGYCIGLPSCRSPEKLCSMLM